MIDFTTTREIVESFISANFTDCPVKYENVGLDAKDLEKWIAVFDRVSVSEAVEMGEDSPFLMGGVIIIQIFTPIGSGTSGGRTIAQDVSDLISQKEIGGMYFLEPELHMAAPTADATWFQMNLVVPYNTVMGQSANTC